MTVEIFHPDPAAIREDPDWPGEEVPRATLPVVIGRAGRPGSFRLVLSGHVDVVPAGDPATWTGDAFSGEIRDGRLYGRGACDMKGGVAAILGAVRALRRHAARSSTLQGELIVALVPSEEDGGQGTLAAIRAGVTGDLCVIPEPSSLDVVIAHAGAITFRLTVPGRAAHASRRTEGVSALDNLQTLVRALEADETRRNAAETEPADDGARAAVPDDRRQGRGRRVGVDRDGPRRRRGALRRAAGPGPRRRRPTSCGRASPPPAPGTCSCAFQPATVEITGRPVRLRARPRGPSRCPSG